MIKKNKGEDLLSLYLIVFSTFCALVPAVLVSVQSCTCCLPQHGAGFALIYPYFPLILLSAALIRLWLREFNGVVRGWSRCLILAGAVSFVVIVAAVFHISSAPIHGWDVLASSEWKVMGYAEHAYRLLNGSDEVCGISEARSRHPATTAGMLAYSRLYWTIDWPQVLPSGGLWLFLYAVIVACAIFTVVGAQTQKGSGNAAASIFCLMALPPLLENHTAIVGYAELAQTAVLATIFICISALERARLCSYVSLIFLIGMLMLLLSTIKAIGALLSLLVACPVAMIHIGYLASARPRGKPRPNLAYLFGTLVSISLIVVIVSEASHDFFIAGRSIGFKEIDVSILAVGSAYAFFLYSSFSIYGSLLLICLVSFLTSIVRDRDMQRADFLDITYATLPVFLGFAILTTHYGQEASPIIADTGFSRTLLPLIVLAVLAMLSFLARNGLGRADGRA